MADKGPNSRAMLATYLQRVRQYALTRPRPFRTDLRFLLFALIIGDISAYYYFDRKTASGMSTEVIFYGAIPAALLLVFDLARRFIAAPYGVHEESLARIVELKSEVDRLKEEIRPKISIVWKDAHP